jgi:hypothetical protein
MAESPFERLPDPVLTIILLQAAQSPCQQQHRYHLCGIFPLVNRRWKHLAHSICHTLYISLGDNATAEQVRCLRGRQPQPLMHPCVLGAEASSKCVKFMSRIYYAEVLSVGFLLLLCMGAWLHEL